MIALPLGKEHILIVRDAADRALVPASDLELLKSCSCFATLGAHADRLVSRFKLPSGARSALLQRLDQLAAHGLLDRASLVARGGDVPHLDVPQPIQIVTIPTRDRPE